MKSIKLLFVIMVAAAMNVSCQAQTGENKETTAVTKADKVEVYYFHLARRCETCKTVEKVSKEAVAELYGEKVSFQAVNLDEAAGKQKGKELDVSGQSLLIVAGDTRINLINEGFLHARTNPDKFKEIIQEKIDPLL